MNAQWHDEFVALCALYPSGELTEEEWALLQVHLAYCESCQEVFAEYRQIVNEVVPVMAAANAEDDDESPESLRAAEERLMAALDELPSSPTKKLSSRYSKVIPSLAIAAGIAGVGWLGFHFGSSKRVLPTAGSAAVVRQEPLPAGVSSTRPDLGPELQSAQREIAALQADLNSAKEQGNQASARLVSVHEQLEKAQAEREKLSGEREELSQQLALARQQAQSLQEKTTSTANDSKQYLVRIAALESRIHDLSGAMEEKDRTLAFDKELLAHDRDIRELIGARDLYIADILDVAQNGKTSKPFGRIFYTKDKSLVFYGYDLDKQPGLKQAVAFQAWGSGDERQDVSLGLFYQDDTKKRWVLRFNDTKTLAHLNKVFVTAEPQGGSSRPTGKPVLMAYLQMQANHP